MSLQNQSSKSKAIRHKDYLYCRIRRQESIASSVREKQKHINYQPNDKDLFNHGEVWFNSGLSLDDADEELRNNINFINGFNRAKRIKNVETSLYELGVNFCKNGVSIEQIPENYRENATVLKGYEDALRDVKHR